ncbi:uncharacterized protein A4U43_C09F7560 [Asparagus officinalis]|uniref:Uncharacterized protein n=1 Tax=Asparagus officinalis TaxID=4686 RepID=A0A5P1E6F8_ASPOF|nr:uncharacterized protein A4U43_C09F7560 [Asparagus officinalis]
MNLLSSPASISSVVAAALKSKRVIKIHGTHRRKPKKRTRSAAVHLPLVHGRQRGHQQAAQGEPPSEVETGVTEVAAVLEVSSEVRERVEEEMDFEADEELEEEEEPEAIGADEELEEEEPEAMLVEEQRERPIERDLWPE